MSSIFVQFGNDLDHREILQMTLRSSLACGRCQAAYGMEESELILIGDEPKRQLAARFFSFSVSHELISCAMVN
jgi:hypothetical protein